MKPPPVFAWITGETTNIGDSLLRRPYVAALSQIGPTELWVRRASADFLTGLDVPAGVRVTHSFLGWYARLLKSALSRRTVLALNAGEVRVRPAIAGLMFALGVGVSLVRLRGGIAVWLGGTVPASDRTELLAPYRWVARRTALQVWREAGPSVRIVPGEVAPDWAFATGSLRSDWAGEASRTSIAFVVRGDRDYPSAEWLSWARRLIATRSMLPIAVVQVEADRDVARRLANDLGGEVLNWDPGVSHAAQEKLVRELYQRCLIVIGDRLHGLVLGATEGAIPLGWVEASRGKIAAHFDAAGLEFVGKFEGKKFEDAPDLSAEDLTQLAQVTAAGIDANRVQLAELTVRLAQVANHVSSQNQNSAALV
ncbi:hypothetical protein GCM10022381_41860 [Leifsonia kafniensis]|uniref:Polysaccharide pyruvyl transferase family protein n=1 Tax=Leifsonia kafniensis TaxID=475957 RepID=A0ABP7L8G0_9MICO